MRKALQADLARIENRLLTDRTPRTLTGPLKLLLEVLRDWPEPEILASELARQMQRRGAKLAPPSRENSATTSTAI